MEVVQKARLVKRTHVPEKLGRDEIKIKELRHIQHRAGAYIPTNGILYTTSTQILMYRHLQKYCCLGLHPCIGLFPIWAAAVCFHLP